METGGLLLYNTSLIDAAPKRTDTKIIPVPCNDIAESLGNSRVANMVMLGAIIEATNAISLDSAMDSLKDVFGEKKASLLPLNRKAMEAGMEAVRKAM